MAKFRQDLVHVVESPVDVVGMFRKIVEETEQEDAFYICDIGNIVTQYDKWMEKFPRVRPHYAVKCNEEPIVIKVLAALGASFDCASKNEIEMVLQMGVSPTRIIFAHPTKPPSHVLYAASANVKRMTFDNAVELDKIKMYFPDAELLLRFRCDSNDAVYKLGTKYGCEPILEAPELLRKARDLNLNVVGVCFHVGSGCGDPLAFRNAISTARDIFDYALTIGCTMNLLDIGGGFPGNWTSSMDNITDVVISALTDIFPDPTVDIISEPGAYFVTSAFTLACFMHSKREIEEAESLKHIMYYINAGVYGAFMSQFIEKNLLDIPTPLKERPRKTYPSSIWGPTLCSTDKLFDNVLMPELSTYEWLVFPNMGAYTISLATTFNGLGTPRVLTVVNEHFWLRLRNSLPLKETDFIPGANFTFDD